MTTGRLVAHYRLAEAIGEGGMGTVYRAFDERLHRFVAVKFLSANVERDPERLRRFTNEARAASALNHPNILTVHEIGDDEGTPFIAMELVDGRTLRERLREGAVPLSEALDIAIQVARGLVAAHEAGIIHRDIKPENVMLRRDGYVKVLDFGLATLHPGGAAVTAMSTVAATAAFVGTIPYLSPEQIDGATVDERTDIFSFGILLCEILTGSNPFARPAVLETLAAIGRTPEPAADAIKALPPQLAAIVTKALQRNPAARYQKMSEIVAALRDAQAELDRRAGASPAPPRRRAIAVSGVVLSIALTAMVMWYVASRPEPPAVPVQLTHFATAVRDPVLSPDGTLLAYIVQEPRSSETQVFVQRLPDGQPQQLTRMPGVKASPAFSPDSARIAFTLIGSEWKWDTWVTSAVGAGTPRLLLPNAASFQWLKDGRVIFAEFKRGAQLAIVIGNESRTGQRDVYVPPPTGMAPVADVSPDGRQVVVGQMGGDVEQQGFLSCFVTTLDGLDAPRRPVGTPQAPCSMFVRWSRPDGRWLYFASGHGNQFHLFRQPAGGGTPEQLTSGTGLAVRGVVTSFALAPDGRSVIYPSGEEQSTLWRHDPEGLDTQLTFEGNARSPIVSDDGHVFYIAAPLFAAGPMYMRNVDGSDPQQICPGQRANLVAPSPNGQRVVFAREDSDGRVRLWIGSVDNSVGPRLLTTGVNDELYGLFTPDGSSIVYVERLPQGQRIWSVRTDGTERRPLTDIEPNLQLQAVSPDGAWISVTRRARTPDEAWLYPLGGGTPRKLWKSWALSWSAANRSFLLSNPGMLSVAWSIPNSAGQLLPPGLGEEPTEAAFRAAGGRKVLSADFFATAAPLPAPFSIIYSMVENRSNLYRLPLRP